MKAITNIGCLEKMLIAEDPSWQRMVFEKTGVIVLPGGQKQYHWDLVSSCGYADLGDDVDSNDGFCVLESIDDLIEYIMSMDAFNCALKNIKINDFYKADLFWAICERILFLNSYQDTTNNTYPDGNQVFGMRAIWGPTGSDRQGVCDGHLWFDMSACGADALSGIYVEVTDAVSLSRIIDLVAEQLECYEDILEGAKLLYHRDDDYSTPITYEEVLAAYKTIRY